MTFPTHCTTWHSSTYNEIPRRSFVRVKSSLIIASVLLCSNLPYTSSEQQEWRERQTQIDADDNHRLGKWQKYPVRHHEERLLAEAGRRFWSRRISDGGQELQKLPAFVRPARNYNSRSRNLAGPTGHDSFLTVENAPPKDYGIGTNTNNHEPLQRSEYRYERKYSKSHSGKGKDHISRPSRPPPSKPSQRPPYPSHIHPPTPTIVRPPSHGNDNGNTVCQTPITWQFLQFSAIPPAVLAIPQAPNVQDMGTRYIYNSELRDATTLDELVGSRSNGVCTRTQSRQDNSSSNKAEVFQLGGGHCSFSYTLYDGNDELTLEASGTVTDSVGGTLAITGGTKDALGAFGEMTLVRIVLPETKGKKIAR